MVGEGGYEGFRDVNGLGTACLLLKGLAERIDGKSAESGLMLVGEIAEAVVGGKVSAEA